MTPCYGLLAAHTAGLLQLLIKVAMSLIRTLKRCAMCRHAIMCRCVRIQPDRALTPLASSFHITVRLRFSSKSQIAITSISLNLQVHRIQLGALTAQSSSTAMVVPAPQSGSHSACHRP